MKTIKWCVAALTVALVIGFAIPYSVHMWDRTVQLIAQRSQERYEARERERGIARVVDQITLCQNTGECNFDK